MPSPSNTRSGDVHNPVILLRRNNSWNDKWVQPKDVRALYSTRQRRQSFPSPDNRAWKVAQEVEGAL